MNYSKELIIIKGNCEDNVRQYCILGDKVKVTYSNGNFYTYNRSNVVIIKNNKQLEHSRFIFRTAQGNVLNNISELYRFEYSGKSFLRFVFEKLQKYGFGFIAAQLGSSDNKTDFIENKQTSYPNFSEYPNVENEQQLRENIRQTLNELKSLFEMRNKLAELERQLYELELEKKHYLEYYNSNFSDPLIFKREMFTSDSLIELWTELQFMSELGKAPNIFKRLKYRFRFGIKNVKTQKTNINTVIAYIKKLIYQNRITEISNEIQWIKNHLDSSNQNTLLNKLTSSSETLLKSKLKKKYSAKRERAIFGDKVWRYPKEFLNEYPILLSTTFSARSCFKDVMYDYVIVDEASQVDLTCGVLAMSCANNIVIVGDTKQLPNVVTPTDREKLSKIGNEFAIEEKYRCEDRSLLSSACEVFLNAPRTLLREHYRCHPKIIDFCNKKFYGDQLIIMTQDNNEKNVIKAHITAAGDHARGHYNQRQIDEITQVILPELASDDVGIIAPYNTQKDAMIKEIGKQIPISTVHKFQGRENDDIIISTVDNEITEFTDAPNMLNVAVSRAKKRLRIVVSDNEANENTNIGDLVRYIRYNNLEVQHSKLYSVFDLLYKCYDDKRKEYLKSHRHISEYDSENLALALIEEILKEEEYSSFDVVSHMQLSTLIRDMNLLSVEEANYAKNPLTHLDFVVFSRVDKSMRFGIEVDGYSFHHNWTPQYERDKKKDSIMRKYNIPLLRLNTVGSGERDKIIETLNEVMGKL